jgi:RNA polymerase sigma-70 factor (family 1)
MRQRNDYTDQELVDDFAKGSQKAFTKLFHQFYSALCYYAFRFTDDQAAAEDIVEETFIVVWNRRESFHHYKVLRSFLYSSVRNACLNWMKQNERHAVHKKIIASNTELSESSVLENLVRAEVFRDVFNALEKLPPKCKEIFTLIFFEGKNIRDVAAELKLSVNTVKAQKRRGLILLRNRLTIILSLVSFFR